ncbi:putative DNA polymerase III subunit epsilon [Paratrimastix pyriformis]|uniref:DNA polymerase III subunit epsilon n=1 Tax=Paratrimastix pyriformis TaxID=342808 RepID=A0ABQ8UD35_9EUKA|nr:putative DNA polymerase III subunit epsilon [Paratrimastix pyriformis]
MEDPDDDEEMRANPPSVPPITAPRVIVFDTETTGFQTFDQIIEIAAVEVMDGDKTGVHFHSYLKRDARSCAPAFRVHHLSQEFLELHQSPERVFKCFLRWVGDAPLVAHNASFDRRMLNQDLARLGMGPLAPERFFCTQRTFRHLYPGRRCGLDEALATCGIAQSKRSSHSALRDAILTASLYRHLATCPLRMPIVPRAMLEPLPAGPAPTAPVTPTAPAPAPPTAAPTAATPQAAGDPAAPVPPSQSLSPIRGVAARPNGISGDGGDGGPRYHFGWGAAASAADVDARPGAGTSLLPQRKRTRRLPATFLAVAAPTRLMVPPGLIAVTPAQVGSPLPFEVGPAAPADQTRPRPPSPPLDSAAVAPAGTHPEPASGMLGRPPPPGGEDPLWGVTGAAARQGAPPPDANDDELHGSLALPAPRRYRWSGESSPSGPCPGPPPLIPTAMPPQELGHIRPSSAGAAAGWPSPPPAAQGPGGRMPSPPRPRSASPSGEPGPDTMSLSVAAELLAGLDRCDQPTPPPPDGPPPEGATSRAAADGAPGPALRPVPCPLSSGSPVRPPVTGGDTPLGGAAPADLSPSGAPQTQGPPGEGYSSLPRLASPVRLFIAHSPTRAARPAQPCPAAPVPMPAVTPGSVSSGDCVPSSLARIDERPGPPPPAVVLGRLEETAGIPEPGGSGLQAWRGQLVERLRAAQADARMTALLTGLEPPPIPLASIFGPPPDAAPAPPGVGTVSSRSSGDPGARSTTRVALLGSLRPQTIPKGLRAAVVRAPGELAPSGPSHRAGKKGAAERRGPPPGAPDRAEEAEAEAALGRLWGGPEEADRRAEAVHFFETATPALIRERVGASGSEAETVVRLRPFRSYGRLVEGLGPVFGMARLAGWLRAVLETPRGRPFELADPLAPAAGRGVTGSASGGSSQHTRMTSASRSVFHEIEQ